jgi:hypothetical protein
MIRALPILLLLGSPALAVDINNGDPYYLCGEARYRSGIDVKCPLPMGATINITMHRDHKSHRHTDWLPSHWWRHHGKG